MFQVVQEHAFSLGCRWEGSGGTERIAPCNSSKVDMGIDICHAFKRMHYGDMGYYLEHNKNIIPAHEFLEMETLGKMGKELKALIPDGELTREDVQKIISFLADLANVKLT